MPSLPKLSFLIALVEAKVRMAEVKAVMCDICERAVSVALDKHLGEDDLDDLCIPNSKSGRWLSYLDIKDESDGSIYVQEHGNPGECRSECSTVARACTKSMDDLETLHNNIVKFKEASDTLKTKKTIIKKMCKKACPGSAKRVVNREKDEEFNAVDPKLGEMQDMMKDMKQKTGMGMKMYSRDDFANMSPGDMEAMAAREALAQERMEDKYRFGEPEKAEL